MKSLHEFMTEASGSHVGPMRGYKPTKKGKKDYDIYHKMYSDAVSAAVDLANKQGYEVDADDLHNSVTTGPRKPSPGKTNSFKLGLTKDGKAVRRMLVFQVYGLENGGKNINGKHYELNAYVS